MTGKHGSLFSHIVITRFSYRGFRMPRGHDVLDPAVLARRFAVFEATCLPSMLGQSSNDFSWVLLVDEMLPPEFRARLEELVSAHGKAFLHTYSKDLRLGTVDWLLPYTSQRTEHILSTQLDDDDILCTDFVARSHAYLTGLQARGGLPRLLFLACRNALQWDMLFTRRAPLGYLKPWAARGPDGHYYPPSTGFSVLSKHSEANFSAQRFQHHLVRFYSTSAAIPAGLHESSIKTVEKVRAELKRCGVRSDRGTVEAEENLLHWLPGEAPQALIVNHGANREILRLFNKHRQRVKIDGLTSLSEFPIDLSAVTRYRQMYPPWSDLTRKLRHAIWRMSWRLRS